MSKTEEKPKKLAVVYVRTAAESSAEENAASQELRCRMYADTHGYEVAKVLTDVGGTAISEDRPGFRELMRYVREIKEQAPIVLVRTLDRLTRDRGFYHVVEQDLKRDGIEIVSTI